MDAAESIWIHQIGQGNIVMLERFVHVPEVANVSIDICE
jgi:hypothetical protein